MNNGKQILAKGKFVNFVTRHGWEYVERAEISGIVGIVAVTGDGKLVLVEQFRPPLDASVIELPAGLAGDSREHAGEPLESAARRELLEETGYSCREMIELASGASSAGITDELITLFRAVGLSKTGLGEGDGHEKITLHEVPIADVRRWLAEQVTGGKRVDMKVYSGLYFAMNA
ncbi:MAG TPA: NUDIX hydrolase [Tepidisphaeraceae bacterium]|jgi:ADP-ribose pyrophosphatase|nr:NUDIX hydrolase [Tepidisphaeraceae bacterium]